MTNMEGTITKMLDIVTYCLEMLDKCDQPSPTTDTRIPLKEGGQSRTSAEPVTPARSEKAGA